MITKMLIKEPSPTYPPVTKIVYRLNERVKFFDIWMKTTKLQSLDGRSAQSSPVAEPAPTKRHVNNFVRSTSPAPLRWSPTTFDRRGARARRARSTPPCSF
jgi:hypothetical protein